MTKFQSWLYESYRTAKRVVIILIGFTVLAVGIVLLVTPGPALVVIPVGLGILAIEFAWARRLLKKVKEKAQDAANHLRRKEKTAGEAAEPTSGETSPGSATADSAASEDRCEELTREG